MEINEIIKQRRKELGLTLKQVAEKLGVSESLISRYESKDVKNMGIDKIAPLAKILKCSPAYLMGWEEEPTKPIDPIIEEYKLSPEEIIEFEKVMSINGALMFNGKEVSQEDKEELEQTLKRIFIRSLLLKRAKERDENGPKNS
ncbi:helix-turn-helix domain-containing protein [Fusobacterium necrophorum]|uniref:helix-turn-helix domain-containing protein n=1 Tax=Fusobacterium necrophorum TaxID=859 RepID=UPI00370EF16A